MNQEDDYGDEGFRTMAREKTPARLAAEEIAQKYVPHNRCTLVLEVEEPRKR